MKQTKTVFMTLLPDINLFHLKKNNENRPRTNYKNFAHSFN